MRLHPDAVAEDVRLIACEELGSTNAHALELARGGEGGPLWITAQRQTRGRGRRGNRWVSPAGNLHASLLLIDPSPVRQAAELSFVAALAVHDAVSELAAALEPRLKLKWPNDVLISGAKVAGILIEAENVGGERLAIVTGIGVNCASHPDGTEFPATDLAACSAFVTAEAMFTALSSAMQRRLRLWDRGRSFAAIRADWIARAAGLGAPVRVRLPTRELAGVFERLDDAGRLVLRSPDGRLEAIAGGEVFALADTARSLAPAAK